MEIDFVTHCHVVVFDLVNIIINGMTDHLMMQEDCRNKIERSCVAISLVLMVFDISTMNPCLP
jgi:hypothetical protein